MRKVIILSVLIIFASTCFAQYQPAGHRKPSGNEIAVTQAGSYAKAGETYVLTNDISSEMSALFLGKNVTLDLNGYTVKYADANYSHIANSGFEEGLKDWDLSNAPGAKVVNTADIHVFLGDKLLSMKAGDEITSSYVYLPVANRSYFAMCGITGRYYHDMKKYPDDEMKVSIYVEDEHGKGVKCMTEYGNSTLLSCPMEKLSPRLGGGFVYAHLTNLQAGKYRIRVKADTDCLVDEIDIRPAMDVGIGIIEKTNPYAHYEHIAMWSSYPAFYDYTEIMSAGKPHPSLPQITGPGTITIKNGTIESGTEGIQSWGIQSSANDVKVILENVNIKTSGISCGAADIPYADIKNCRFDVDMPFLIQRHVGLCAVVMRGENPTEIANSEFYGGQGCLSVKGKHSLVHDNLFINEQTVTNHYSIMGTGDSSRIYNNRFEPRQGSGIYVSRYTEVANNVFKIETSPPTCEYGREEYSTAAIRMGDYHAKPGSPKASIGNRIHGNKIYITANNYPEPETYIPMAWGIFYSARGGDNYVYNNEFVVNKPEPLSKAETAALYICGGPEYFGGQFYNNRITTNVPAAWIGTVYGAASKSKLYNNTIIPLDGAQFKTFKLGYRNYESSVARDIEFRSNKVEGGNFEIDVTDQDHSYSVYWTLKVMVAGKNGNPVGDVAVQIFDNNQRKVVDRKTNDAGVILEELMEYDYRNSQSISRNPYTIVVGNVTRQVELNRNTDVTVEF